MYVEEQSAIDNILVITDKETYIEKKHFQWCLASQLYKSNLCSLPEQINGRKQDKPIPKLPHDEEKHILIN